MRLGWRTTFVRFRAWWAPGCSWEWRTPSWLEIATTSDCLRRDSDEHACSVETISAVPLPSPGAGADAGREPDAVRGWRVGADGRAYTARVRGHGRTGARL